MLNRLRARKRVTHATDESTYLDRRCFQIAHADRRLRHGRLGLKRDTSSLRTGGLILRSSRSSRRHRRLSSDGLGGAIGGSVSGDAPRRPLRLTVPQLRAFLTATHRGYLLLQVATWVELRLVPVPNVRADKRHRKVPASRIATPEAFAKQKGQPEPRSTG